MVFSLLVNSPCWEILLPERKEGEETDEMDQVELVDFDPNPERWCHYNREACEDDKHHPRVAFRVRPLGGASEGHSPLALCIQW